MEINLLNILQNKADGKLSYFQIYLTGCVGGICPVAILCPTELVKIRLQDQLSMHNSFCEL